MNELFNPTAMQNMDKVPLYMMGDAYEWMQRAKQTDAATLADIMAKRQREAELHPIKVASDKATLEGLMLGNQGKQLALDKTRALQPAQIDNELKKLALDATDNEWREVEQRIRRGVYENNAEALRLYEQMPAIREARIKHQQDMEKEREQTRRSFGVAQIGADSRRSIEEMRAAQRGELERIKQAAGGGKLSLNQLASNYIQKASEQTDPAMRAYYMDLANTAAAVAAQMTPAGQAPQINPAALPPGTPLQAPATPTLPPAPNAKPTAKAPPTQADLEFTAKKYGITVEEVKKRLGM